MRKVAGEMNGLDELRGHGRMSWIEAEQGWVAVPEEIVSALSRDGFAECKRAVTTSRRDSRPAGGVWQGINPGTGGGEGWLMNAARASAALRDGRRDPSGSPATVLDRIDLLYYCCSTV